MAKVVTIQQCITELHPDAVYNVPVLAGAPKWLVSERYLRNKYHTNRDIKYWSTYFLLKALTTSGDIQNWRSQRQLILSFLQMSEAIFYSHLRVLKERKLLTVDDAYNIQLVSYQTAADIMGLYYDGLIHIPYNPIKNEGKQIFQHFLRVEEIRHNQHRQLDALVFHLDKNLPLRNIVLQALVNVGADLQRLLKDKHYLQERLLKLQQEAFRHGSNILTEIFAVRADVNRGVRCIKEYHNYISKTSVSYLKRRLFNLKLITVQKICIQSKCKARFYIHDPANQERRKDGYKWIERKKDTAWFLTDQININYEPLPASTRFALQKKAA